MPGPGEVRVALKAAALNHRELWISRGLYPGMVLPSGLGADGAGVLLTVQGIVEGHVHELHAPDPVGRAAAPEPGRREVRIALALVRLEDRCLEGVALGPLGGTGTGSCVLASRTFSFSGPLVGQMAVDGLVQAELRNTMQVGQISTSSRTISSFFSHWRSSCV